MKLLYLALFILLIIIIYEVRCCYKEGLDQPEASVAKSSLVDSLSDIVTSFTSGDKSEKADDSIKIVPGSMIGVTPIRGKGDQPFSFSESKVIDPDAGKAGTGGSSAEDATKSAAQLAIEEKRKLLGDNFLEVDENGPIYDAASYSMHPDTTLEKAIYVCSNNNYKTDDSGETGGWSKKPLDGKPCIGFYNLASNEKQFHILVPCDDDCDQLDVTPLENDLDKMPPEGEVFYPESPNEDVGLVWRQKAVSSDGKALAHGRVDMSDKFKELTEGELIKNAEIAKVSKKGITKTQAFNECGHKKGKIDGNQCIGVIKKKGENKYHYLYKALGEYEPDNNIENAYRRINMDDENVYKKIFKGNPIRGVRAIMGDTMEAKSKAAAESGSDIMSVMKRANELKGASIDETETSVDGPVGTGAGAGAGGAGGAGGGIVWKSAQEIVKENEEKTGPAPPTRENCEKNIAKRYEGGQFKKSSVNKFLAKRCKSAFPDMYNWWTEQEGYKNLFDESEGVYAAENIQAAKNQCSSLNNCLGLFKREKSDKYNLLEKSGLNYGIGKPDPSIEKIWLNENLNKKLDKKWETNVKREAKRLKFLVNEVTETKKILNEYEIDKKIEYSKVTGSIEGDDEALYNSLNECNQNKFPENAGEVPEGTLCKGVYKEKDKYNFYFLSEGGEEDVLHRPEKIEKVWRHKINYNVSNSSIIVKRMEEYLKKMKEEIMVAAKTAFDKRNREKLQKGIINSEYQIKQINDEMEKLKSIKENIKNKDLLKTFIERGEEIIAEAENVNNIIKGYLLFLTDGDSKITDLEKNYEKEKELVHTEYSGSVDSKTFDKDKYISSYHQILEICNDNELNSKRDDKDGDKCTGFYKDKDASDPETYRYYYSKFDGRKWKKGDPTSAEDVWRHKVNYEEAEKNIEKEKDEKWKSDRRWPSCQTYCAQVKGLNALKSKGGTTDLEGAPLDKKVECQCQDPKTGDAMAWEESSPNEEKPVNPNKFGCIGQVGENTPYYYSNENDPGCCTNKPWDYNGVKYCSSIEANEKTSDCEKYHYLDINKGIDQLPEENEKGFPGNWEECKTKCLKLGGSPSYKSTSNSCVCKKCLGGETQGGLIEFVNNVGDQCKTMFGKMSRLWGLQIIGWKNDPSNTKFVDKCSKNIGGYTDRRNKYCKTYDSYKRHATSDLNECKKICNDLGEDCNAFGIKSEKMTKFPSIDQTEHDFYNISANQSLPHCITYKNCKLSRDTQNWGFNYYTNNARFIEPENWYCSGLSNDTSKPWYKRGGQNLGTFPSEDINDCLDQCKKEHPGRKGYQCKKDSYPSGKLKSNGRLETKTDHYYSELCNHIVDTKDKRKSVDDGWGNRLYDCCQYNFPKELGGVGPYNGKTEGNANGYMGTACSAGYNFDSSRTESLSYGNKAENAGKLLRKENTGKGYKDSSTSRYSGQECMPGYALREKYKKGGYQTYWGCGRNYYRKQHQRQYVSNSGCGTICAKEDFFKELI